MGQLRYDDRVAVITGGGRGLGRSYALQLASRGAKVLVNDTGGGIAGEDAVENPAADVVAEIEAAGGEAAACTETVTTPAGGKAIVEAALDHFGRVDILIHNAGIMRTQMLRDISQEDFNDVVRVHGAGAFNVVRPAFPHMCDAGYGRIVLTSSICGVYGCPGNVNYAMAKTAMIGLNNIAALEGAEAGVKSNVILPAAMTRMAGEWDNDDFPPMTSEQVAPAVAWLCHENCSISGEMLTAIGGRVAKVFVSETRGVYQPAWTIEDIDSRMDAILDMADPVHFPVLPEGHNEHIGYSFEMGYHSHKGAAG
jgi:NAD(P)-dependent dehydrogenase (short-subunit alcohol dehydrogenase family)